MKPLRLMLCALMLIFFFSRKSLAAVEELWWQKAVFYEIFVRSFQDSNRDGVGDLAGLTSRLDYLNDGEPGKGSDLEIDAIWLMPIFKTGSYHGYDTEDYYSIHPEYGTMQDFETFLKEAHRRNIKVILDLVINHTSSQHPWFQASLSQEKSFRDYYIWKSSLPGAPWAKPWGGGDSLSVWNYRPGQGYYYSAFSPRMPDLNLSRPEVREEIFRIARFWLDKGVDGFRLDAARYLIETGPGKGQADTRQTLNFWKTFRRFVKSVNPQAVLVGEVWTANSTVARYYQGGHGLDLCFNFEAADKVPAAVRFSNHDGFVQSWQSVQQGRAPLNFYAPFLSNHDTIRSMNTLNLNPLNSRLAAVLLLTQPGTPFLYYGEEIGIQQENGRSDSLKRAPMIWDSSTHGGFSKAEKIWHPQFPQKSGTDVRSQLDKTDSLLSLYRKLIRIRHRYPSLSLGSISFPPCVNKKILIYRRYLPGESILILLNGSKNVQTFIADESIRGTYQDLLSNSEIILDGHDLNLEEKTAYILRRKGP